MNNDDNGAMGGQQAGPGMGAGEGGDGVVQLVNERRHHAAVERHAVAARGVEREREPVTPAPSATPTSPPAMDLKPLEPYRVCAGGFDIFRVPNFARDVFGVDPGALQTQLESTYPIRHAGDAIAPGEVQWIEGDHSALKYRGNTLKRGKIWLQRGDPETAGFRRYYYVRACPAPSRSLCARLSHGFHTPCARRRAGKRRFCPRQPTPPSAPRWSVSGTSTTRGRTSSACRAPTTASSRTTSTAPTRSATITTRCARLRTKKKCTPGGGGGALAQCLDEAFNELCLRASDA